MAKYLIENLGDAVHTVMVRGEGVELQPGQRMVETLTQGEAKRLEFSAGLRLTSRDEAAQPEDADASPKARAAASKAATD